ncbi:MAG: AMP-binding protein [Bacteroidales bacterium]|nr:AMP-binding protein [Bacteroidales bacterium]MDY0217092.1 AMP-binding protein [Bacteroidales bacterium]
MTTDILSNIHKKNYNNALCINNEFYTYRDLAIIAAKIQNEIKTNYPFERVFGVAFEDDINTYASVIAIWSSGKAYCLLNPDGNREDNYELIQKTGCSVIFNSSYILSKALDFTDQYTIINPNEIPATDTNLRIAFGSYNIFLFTQYKNGQTSSELIQFRWEDVVNAIENIKKTNISLNSKGRVLSFFSFSHNLSVFSFLISIKAGACFYSIPNKKNRAFITFSMVEEYSITHAFTTPHAVKMLEPFFYDIPLSSLHYLIVTGDILPVKHAQNLQKCAPNAVLYNTSSSPFIFGITAAIEIDESSKLHSFNGLVSFGYPLNNIKYRTLSPDKSILNTGEIGELYIQNTAVEYSTIYNNENNLLDDNSKNKISEQNLDNHYLYKTGAVGYINDDNAIIPVANIYQKINMNGILVDLSLLEKHAVESSNSKEVIAVTYNNFFGFDEIHLFIQNLSMDTSLIFQHLRNNIPEYLLPQQIHNIDQIPINEDCLVDYPELLRIIRGNSVAFFTK